jgi:hypothetical protein
MNDDCCHVKEHATDLAGMGFVRFADKQSWKSELGGLVVPSNIVPGSGGAASLGVSGTTLFA